jgi:SAM-dependent methyltransferase
MGFKGAVRDLLRRLVRPYGYELMDRAALYEWQRPSAVPFQSGGLTDPCLTETNPRLVALRERYVAFDEAVTTPDLWTTDYVAGDRLRYFRGSDAYLWQRFGPNMNDFGYVLTTYYVRSIDTLALMRRLTDDDAFGNFTMTIDGTIVSRDMLDSIIELYFLERHLKLSSLPGPRILDIGAGYGRLAHRICESLPNVAEYVCVDAVAQSTLISELYLKFRGSRARVVALDEIEATLARWTPDVAVNVHSFSECRMEAIDWWLGLLEKSGVRHLMIVPNDPYEDGGDRLVTNDRRDFSALLTKHGYKEIVREPKYRDPLVQRYAINPTHHFLFELS